MVYGLNPEKMNCDRLFNLFCLYGNVIKVIRDFKTSRRPPELRRVLRGLPPAALFWCFDYF